MKKTAKIVAVVLALVLALSLAASGSSSSTAAREMTPAFAEELYRLSRLAYCGN